MCFSLKKKVLSIFFKDFMKKILPLKSQMEKEEEWWSIVIDIEMFVIFVTAISLEKDIR